MSANAPPPTAAAAADAATAVTAGVVDPVAPATAEAESNAAPAVAAVAPVSTAAPPRPARPCWSMIVAGYILTALGVAMIPVAPKLKSPLVARCVLILCMTALAAGAAAVVWGFVRDALRRRG